MKNTSNYVFKQLDKRFKRGLSAEEVWLKNNLLKKQRIAMWNNVKMELIHPQNR